jgi:hypothetical protein
VAAIAGIATGKDGLLPTYLMSRRESSIKDYAREYSSVGLYGSQGGYRQSGGHELLLIGKRMVKVVPEFPGCSAWV